MPPKAELGMRPRLILLFACLLFLIQCFTFARTRFVEDEGWNSDIAMTWMREGTLRMSSFPTNIAGQLDGRPPLLSLAMGEMFRWFGPGVLQARISSILAGLGVVVLAFFLGLELGGPWVASVSALLMACDNFLVVAARTARPEVHTALFGCLGVLLYYIGRRKNSFGWTFLAAISIGIAIGFHPLGIGFAMAIGVLLLMELRLGILWSARAWGFVLGIAVALAPYAIWFSSDELHRAAFRANYVSTAAGASVSRVAGEITRLSDFVGIGSQRLPLPFHIPYRLHIVLIIAGALIYLFRKRPQLAREILALVVVNFLWWVFMINKSPRYITALVPIFAVTAGVALVSLAQDVRWKRAAIALGLIFGLSQLAGNAFVLYRFRHADYESVTRQLRSVIPPSASVYGIITFYLALNDHPYYSYGRTDFQYAISNLRAEYLILYDRVMMHGSGLGVDDYGELRNRATEFVKTHATLAGRVTDEFYGEMEVYRVNYPVN